VDLLLAGAGVSPTAVVGHDRCKLTHAAVAAQVAAGSADAGMGVETAAARGGLGFVPLLHERYFLAASSGAAGGAAAGRRKSLRADLHVESFEFLQGYCTKTSGCSSTGTPSIRAFLRRPTRSVAAAPAWPPFPQGGRRLG